MAWNTYSISKLKNWGVAKKDQSNARSKPSRANMEFCSSVSGVCVPWHNLSFNSLVYTSPSSSATCNTVSFLIQRLHTLPTAFFHNHPMVLASPASLGLPCSLGLTFLASQYSSEPPCREFDLALLLTILSSVLEPWWSLDDIIMLAQKGQHCGWCHQVLVCMWSVVWLPFPTTVVACVSWQLNIMQTRPEARCSQQGFM